MREKAGCLCLLAHYWLTNEEKLPKQPQSYNGYPTNTTDENAKRKRVIRNRAAGSKIGLVPAAILQRCKFQRREKNAPQSIKT